MDRWRQPIESTFIKLGGFRTVATRYGKADASFRAIVDLAATIVASR